MSGHSKWSTIKHKKAAEDKKRSKIFTRLIRELMVAAKQGGGDVSCNPSLRLALDNAKSENMPKDTIERAVKRGTGEIQGADYIEVVYEGHGPAGVAIICKSLTDNRTRTVANVRTAFNKNGGTLGDSGAVGWMFENKGIIVYANTICSEDEIFEAAIEAGADDVEVEGDVYKIITEVADFAVVRDALAAKYAKAEDADLDYVVKTPTPVTDLETAQKVIKLIDAIEDDDDIQSVTTNMDISEELASQL
ncbi:MAG: YebC/PmpR family DNA-binding transcriptional regulator [Proteobacteria bacterium]|nr:YebC/PmpR family DNA-binding transcriptional regulator [Pseudomonadota bacterium]